MFTLVADPQDSRVTLFQEALRRFAQPAAQVVGYHEITAGTADLRQRVAEGGVVRLDSPGRSFDLYRAFLHRGADAAEAEGSPFIGASRINGLAFDKGRIVFPRQWFLGFVSILREIQSQLDGAGVRWTADPRDVATLFEKDRCQALLAEHGVPVPRMLNPVSSYEQLRERLTDHGCRRAFVKLKHGSSASGVVAYETNGRLEQAWTTVEMGTRDGEVVLYNSRRLRRYRRREEIAMLIDELARHGVHVEQWVPKLAVRGRPCDLRVLTIAGSPAHRVLRLGRGPMTNLHLLNERCDADALRSVVSEQAWDDLLRTCETAAHTFERTHCMALDVAVAVGGRRHFVLEANAFGDLLHDVHHDGLTPHEAQVQSLLNGWSHRRRAEESAGCQPCST